MLVSFDILLKAWKRLVELSSSSALSPSRARAILFSSVLWSEPFSSLSVSSLLRAELLPSFTEPEPNRAELRFDPPLRDANDIFDCWKAWKSCQTVFNYRAALLPKSAKEESVLCKTLWPIISLPSTNKWKKIRKWANGALWYFIFHSNQSIQQWNL